MAGGMKARATSKNTLFSIDDHSEGGLRYEGVRFARAAATQVGVADPIRFVYGSSPEVFSQLDVSCVDLAFIDGNHRGEQLLGARDWKGSEDLHEPSDRKDALDGARLAAHSWRRTTFAPTRLAIAQSRAASYCGPDEWFATLADPVSAQSAIDRFTNAYDLIIEARVLFDRQSRITRDRFSRKTRQKARKDRMDMKNAGFRRRS
jgi:hypothetical protein